MAQQMTYVQAESKKEPATKTTSVLEGVVPIDCERTQQVNGHVMSRITLYL
jgi:hypothetical protein